MVAPFDLSLVACVSRVEAVVVCCCQGGIDITVRDVVAFFVGKFETGFAFHLSHTRGPAGVVDGSAVCVEEMDIHLCDGDWHGECREDSRLKFVVCAQDDSGIHEEFDFVVGRQVGSCLNQ